MSPWVRMVEREVCRDWTGVYGDDGELCVLIPGRASSVKSIGLCTYMIDVLSVRYTSTLNIH